jgi:hypothetical protein
VDGGLLAGVEEAAPVVTGGAADVEPVLIHSMRMNISMATANSADTPITTLRLLLPSFTYA